VNGPAREHCVVWVGKPTSTERSRLEKADWVLRVTDADACTGVGARSDSRVVAVADLRQRGDGDGRALERLMADCPDVPWVALVPPEISTRQPWVGRILKLSSEFLSAPVDVTRLLDVLAGVVGGSRTPANDEGAAGLRSARSPAMQAVAAILRKYAPVDLPVLITGETGTGKEHAARALHQMSLRCDGPFVAINCGALPASLVQAELFGHERGAFTGAAARRIGHIESAAGGTILLDEVGDLPDDAQTSLLRFLQEGTIERVGSSQSRRIDARVVAATHVDLERAVAEGRFREDLYYRLNVLRLHMPPLRERECDIEPLARHFLDAFCASRQGTHLDFGEAAVLAMRRFAWPGNVRELENRVYRAAVVAEEGLITELDLGLASPAQVGADAPNSLGQARGQAERDVLLQCLRETGFNVSECARRLHISRVSVYRLCRKHRVDPGQMR